MRLSLLSILASSVSAFTLAPSSPHRSASALSVSTLSYDTATPQQQLLTTLYNAAEKVIQDQKVVIDALKGLQSQQRQDVDDFTGLAATTSLRNKLVNADWQLVLVTDGKLESIIPMAATNIFSMQHPVNADGSVSDYVMAYPKFHSKHERAGITTLNPRILPMSNFIVADEKVAVARGDVGGFALWKRVNV